MLSLLSGIFLGWSLGANDAANAFGPAVTSRMIKFWYAAGVAAVFVLLGALAEGQAPIETLKNITSLSLKQAIVSSVAAAATVTVMTLFGFPVSTSQAVVGAILGIGFMNRQQLIEPATEYRIEKDRYSTGYKTFPEPLTKQPRLACRRLACPTSK